MKTLQFLFLLILIGCAKDPFLTDNSGTFKDSRDKHEYKWVKIGTQFWMAENLAYLPAVNPSSDGSESSAFYYVYNYEGSSISEAKSKGNYTSYGVLYNWVAAKAACPSGWHLPSNAEWIVLSDYLGSSAGAKMKATSGWNSNGNGDNSSGFTALPGGYRESLGGFNYLGYDASFWSSSELGLLAWVQGLYFYDSGAGRYDYNRGGGFAVRCLKDQ